MFPLLQTRALGGSKHGLCIDDWGLNQIKGGGEEGRGDMLPLTPVPLGLCSPLTAASLEGRAAEAFCRNEEKCINLAGPACRLSAGRVKVHPANPFS